MSLIRDALDFLKSQALESAAPRPIDPGDPRHIAYAIGGQVKTFPVVPDPRRHAVGTLEDLILLASRFADREETDADGNPNHPVVWYGREGVVLVIDDHAHRIETATFDLVESDVFRALRHLAEQPVAAWLDQKAFVRLLRITLAGTLEPHELLNSVRRITWSSSADSTVARQRESLARDVEARTSDGKDLPEEVNLVVRVHKSDGEVFRYPVPCSVEVNPAEGKLRLLPMPDALEAALADALDSVRDRLTAGLPGSVPCYRGAPGPVGVVAGKS